MAHCSQLVLVWVDENFSSSRIYCLDDDLQWLPQYSELDSDNRAMNSTFHNMLRANCKGVVQRCQIYGNEHRSTELKSICESTDPEGTEINGFSHHSTSFA